MKRGRYAPHSTRELWSFEQEATTEPLYQIGAGEEKAGTASGQY